MGSNANTSGAPGVSGEEIDRYLSRPISTPFAGFPSEESSTVEECISERVVVVESPHTMASYRRIFHFMRECGLKRRSFCRHVDADVGGSRRREERKYLYVAVPQSDVDC